MNDLREMSTELKKNFLDDVLSIVTMAGEKGLAVSDLPTLLRSPKFLGGAYSGRVWTNIPGIESLLYFLEGEGFTVKDFGRTRRITV